MILIFIMIYLCISIGIFVYVLYDNYDCTWFGLYKSMYDNLREDYNVLGSLIPVIAFFIFTLPLNIIYLFIGVVLYFVIDFIPSIWDMMFGRHD